MVESIQVVRRKRSYCVMECNRAKTFSGLSRRASCTQRITAEVPYERRGMTLAQLRNVYEGYVKPGYLRDECAEFNRKNAKDVERGKKFKMSENLYALDTFAEDKADTARRELHRLLEDRELAATPLLVLANKIDLEPHMSESDVIRELNLEYVTENPWLVLPISALKQTNIDQVIDWLIKQSRKN